LVVHLTMLGSKILTAELTDGTMHALCALKKEGDSTFAAFRFVLALLVANLLITDTLIAVANAADNSISIIVPEDVLKDYQQFLASRDPHGIRDYSGTGTRRDVVEVLLAVQALRLGGITEQPTFLTADSYTRLIREIQDGRALLVGTTLWRDDVALVDKDVYVSQSLIRNGEFEAGLFTSTSNTRALNVRSLNELQQLSAVSNKDWSTDWQTLQALALKELFSTVEWESMVRMVDGKRADVLLAPFPTTADLTLVVGKITLRPIPGLKIGLSGSRHLIVAKHHPKGSLAFIALEKGLTILRDKSHIEQAYRDSGFLNQQTRNWTQLKPPAQDLSRKTKTGIEQ